MHVPGTGQSWIANAVGHWRAVNFGNVWIGWSTCTFHPPHLITSEPDSRTEDGGDKLEIQNMIDREEKEREGHTPRDDRTSEKFSSPQPLTICANTPFCCSILHKLQVCDMILIEAMVERAAVTQPLREMNAWMTFTRSAKKAPPLHSFHLFIKIQFGITTWLMACHGWTKGTFSLHGTTDDRLSYRDSWSRAVSLRGVSLSVVLPTLWWE